MKYINKRNRHLNYQCILINNENNTIACKDNLFRFSVLFGTEKYCCKFWKIEGFAHRFAKKHGLKSYTIKRVYKGDTISSTGNVTTEAGTNTHGYITNI